MEQAIKCATEGGYPYKKQDGWVEGTAMLLMLLDPIFWCALGKQQMWHKAQPYAANPYLWEDGWMRHWHELIDHIADGGNIDDFFNELLK